jgi:hypothetical protein
MEQKRFLLLALPSHYAVRAALSQAADDRLIAAHLMEDLTWVRDASQMADHPAGSKIYCAPYAYKLLDDAWKIQVAEMKIDLVELNSVSIKELINELRR